MSEDLQPSVTHDSAQCGKVVMCCRRMALIKSLCLTRLDVTQHIA